MVRRTFLLGLTAALAACAPSLSTFNALTPHDGGVRKLEADAAYGSDERQRLDVYAPAPSAASLPILVFFYGGGWSSGDKADYAFVGAAFAARGFLTVIPDYRLVPDVRFPAFVDDGARALRWVQINATRLGGDPSRIVIVGHSAGAYIAAMLALDAHYMRDAGVDATSIRGAVGVAGPYDFLPLDVDATRDAFSEANDLQATQPMHFARADAPPLLLLWGEKDNTVGRRSIDALARAQTEAGGAVETKIYPRIGHIEIMLALSRVLRGRAPVLADVTAFARRVTQEHNASG